MNLSLLNLFVMDPNFIYKSIIFYAAREIIMHFQNFLQDCLGWPPQFYNLNLYSSNYFI